MGGSNGQEIETSCTEGLDVAFDSTSEFAEVPDVAAIEVVTPGADDIDNEWLGWLFGNEVDRLGDRGTQICPQ